MRRGDVWSVDLDPVQGAEAARRRPAVLVSNDRANATASRIGYGVVTVVPLTSNVSVVYPFQVLLPADRVMGTSRPSRAQVEQVRSVDVGRVHRKLGHLSEDLMDEIDSALKFHLALV